MDNTTPRLPYQVASKRAGHGRVVRRFVTLAEAAAYSVAHPGAIAELQGKVYRVISGREQDAAEAEARK
jgi:hypothetical protein